MEEKLKEFYSWMLRRQRQLDGCPEELYDLNQVINKFEELGLDAID